MRLFWENRICNRCIAGVKAWHDCGEMVQLYLAISSVVQKLQ